MTFSPDPVAVATGMLVERFHIDVKRAHAMLTEYANGNGHGLVEYAAWLVETAGASLTGLAAGDEPASVRRAAEFIHANAQHDIGTDDIASAAGLGVRSLQSRFRQYRGQTPTDYVRAVRLENAHRDLVAADPATGRTVAGIAARWGFAHPGRFAEQYKRAYGYAPSRTLRR